ncbi:MAG: TraR/DksA C4-type zinc finger protein [Candidatus Paceibacterota bacterium]
MKNDINTDHYKKLLEQEQKELEEDLATLGQINPDNESDWEVVKEDLNVMDSDLNELADEFEEFEEDAAILNELEIRLNEVRHALRKIEGNEEAGEYGICEVSGKPISKERLEINPAARAGAEDADKLHPLYPNQDN